MHRKSLLWKIYPTYLALIVLCTAGATWYSLDSLKAFYLEQTRRDLESRAWLVERHLESCIETGDTAAVDAACKSLGRASRTRITVIAADGVVIGDSAASPLTMENHADRPEFKQALAGGVAAHSRRSPTLDAPMTYVAVPLRKGDSVAAVVRTAVPMTEIDKPLAQVYATVILGAFIVALLAAVSGYYLSRRITRPLLDLRDGAGRFADGDLAYRVIVPDSEEMAALAEALNSMAADLDAKITIINRQASEQQAVLSCMSEGIIAVDTSARVLMTNAAATALLSVPHGDYRGRLLQEIIRNARIEALLADILATGAPASAEITLRGPGAPTIEIQGSPLTGSAGRSIGALLVLTDVSRLRRLETVRRDFVANVSHELKTPVTSIKGFVETLREGAADPEQAARFLDIIAKQAERLNAIIDDLLMLSRMEDERRSREIPFEDVRVSDVIASAVALVAAKADKATITIDVACPPELKARLNALLMEQAVANLLDNAVKYSKPGGVVTLNCREDQRDILISVSDRGCGIAPGHLPRIFERFYRTDTARSRALGGTGLGLSIVKHIAQAHGGSVSVESTEGAGSTFTIRVPRA